MLRKLWNDELGVIISAELVLVLTIAVLAMVVGLQAVSKSVNHELSDLADAFGVIDQSFSYEGIKNARAAGLVHSTTAGAAYTDNQDDCDCTELVAIVPTAKLDNMSGAAENTN